MKQDDLAAELARLLEPTTTELADEDTIVPYWAMSGDAGRDSVESQVGADFAPDLANFLSDAFAAEATGKAPSLADIAAYVDGGLDGAEREAFEAALVASPDLRAEVEMLIDRVAMFEGADFDVETASAMALDPARGGSPPRR